MESGVAPSHGRGANEYRNAALGVGASGTFLVSIAHLLPGKAETVVTLLAPVLSSVGLWFWPRFSAWFLEEWPKWSRRRQKKTAIAAVKKMLKKEKLPPEHRAEIEASLNAAQLDLARDLLEMVSATQSSSPPARLPMATSGTNPIAPTKTGDTGTE